jgi:hypothetical protein
LPNIESGAKSSIGVTSLIFDQLNNKIRHSKINGVATRAVNYFAVNFYLGLTGYATLPHEYFGHYSRAREFGITPKLTISFPAPGGDDVFRVPHSMSATERQMIVAGGPELTSQIAFEATKEMYSGNVVPAYQGLYLFAGKVVDGIMYTQNNVKPFLDDPNKYYDDNKDYFKKNPVPNDPLAYALALTESYGYYENFLPKNATWLYKAPDLNVYKNEFIEDQYRRMKRAYILQLLDLTSLYGLYGAYQYIVNDKAFIKPFMLKVHGVKFMPYIRANMGELGAENYYDLFITPRSNLSYNIYYRHGGNMFDKIDGAGGEVRAKISSKLSLTSGIDFWNNERTDKKNFNTLQTLRLKLQRLALATSVGYKTKGALMGKPWDEGVYGYFGVGYSFDYKTAK